MVRVILCWLPQLPSQLVNAQVAPLCCLTAIHVCAKLPTHGAGFADASPQLPQIVCCGFLLASCWSPGNETQVLTHAVMLQILRMPLFQLPQLISQLVNAQVAITRLREFLAAAEQHTMAESPPSSPGTAGHNM